MGRAIRDPLHASGRYFAPTLHVEIYNVRVGLVAINDCPKMLNNGRGYVAFRFQRLPAACQPKFHYRMLGFAPLRERAAEEDRSRFNG